MTTDYFLEHLTEKSKQKHARSLQCLERGDTAAATFAAGGESTCAELIRELKYMMDNAERERLRQDSLKAEREKRKQQRKLAKVAGVEKGLHEHNQNQDCRRNNSLEQNVEHLPGNQIS